MLAGYQRFVAYVYEYRKGKKDGSSGYVRVEARGQECRIEVHLRCAGLEPGSRCRVYGFVRREGLMDGILIGSCVTGREQIECMLETDTENIGGMGKNLRELGGMLLISDAGGFWGTEWDDQSIRPDNFREWKKEETDAHKEKKTEKGEGQRGETAEAEEDQKAGFSAEVQEKQNAADKIMTVEEVQEEVEGISVSTMNQETKKGLQENRAIFAEDEPKISEAGRPHPGQAHPEPGSRPPESPRPGSPSPGPGPRPPEPPRPPRPTPGIPYDPFNDGQFTDCRKIKPSDCSTLCRKNGCFCNNRFVMYGYQNFGHLLLCRNHRGQYILGVPGSYSQQERFMANMFGFPYFRESPKIHIPGGKGGYWYCFINI